MSMNGISRVPTGRARRLVRGNKMELQISAAKAASRAVARLAALAAFCILLACVPTSQAASAQYDVLAGLGQFDWDTNFDGIADGWVPASIGDLRHDLRLVKNESLLMATPK